MADGSTATGVTESDEKHDNEDAKEKLREDAMLAATNYLKQKLVLIDSTATAAQQLSTVLQALHIVKTGRRLDFCDICLMTDTKCKGWCISCHERSMQQPVIL